MIAIYESFMSSYTYAYSPRVILGVLILPIPFVWPYSDASLLLIWFER